MGETNLPLRVGVLAVQGAVSEHADALHRAAEAGGFVLEVIAVRTPEQLANVAGIILPGGESTTISRLLRSGGLQDDLVRRAREGDLAVFGTCAGLILLSSEAQHDVQDKDIELLKLLDCAVDRNAFGRQRESFQADLEVAELGTMPAVFIRAPSLERVWGETQALASVNGAAVLVEKGTVLGAAFHPELTPDTRLHQRFLAACQAVQAAGSFNR